MATPISRGIEPIGKTVQRGRGQWLRGFIRLTWLIGTIACLGGGPDPFAAGTNQITAARRVSPESLFTARARKAFYEARRRFQAETNDVEAAWQFGRACFDLAEWAFDNDERAELADEGIAACRRSIGLLPGSAAAHYYLGMNLGQLARTRGLSALRLVNEMEREFTIARELDAHFDFAGPDRNLGFLYRDAPSIGSIGSRTKARRHFRNALELAPDYPENGLNLIETLLKWNIRTEAQREFKTLEKLWPEARQKFAGDAWEPGWFDWDKRFEVLKKKFDDASKPIESPRGAE